MHVSINELKLLVQRALEAVLGPGQDTEDAAQQVVWLQAHGFPGVSSLITALPRIAATEKVPSTPPAHEDRGYRVDLAGASLVLRASAVTDLCIAYAATDGACLANVIDGADPLFLIPCVARCSGRGLNAIATWRDAEAGLAYVARATAGQSEPVYENFAVAAEPTVPGKSECWLGCTADEARFRTLCDALVPATTGGGRATVITTTEQMLHQLRLAVRDGLQIQAQHYDGLTAIANRLLVASSDQSRRGAGA